MEQSGLPPFISVIHIPKSGVGYGVRFTARVIDSIVHFINWYVATFLIGIAINIYSLITGFSTIETITISKSANVIGYLLALFGTFFYHVISEYIYGASLGKLVFKIHVITGDGQPISLKAALIRSSVYFVDGLFLGLVAYENMKKTPLNQRYGDKFANTVVVKRSNLVQSQIPSVWKFILAFTMAVLADIFCAVLATIIKLI